MTHRAKQIFSALTTALTGLTTTATNIKQSRVWAVHQVPALTVRLGPMLTQETIGQLTDQALTVLVDIHVKAKEESIDDDVLLIHQEIWKAVMADYSLGLPFVIDTTITDLSEPVLSGDGERAGAKATLTIEVKFRHSLADPGA